MVRTTHFEKLLKDECNNQSEIFVKSALNKDLSDSLRQFAVSSVVKSNQQKAVDIAFKIMLNKEEKFFTTPEKGEYQSTPLASTVLGIVSDLSKKTLEEARKRGYLELKIHEDDEEILNRIRFFMESVRSELYPLDYFDGDSCV